MQDDVSKVTVSVIVNHTKRETAVKLNGDKCPISFIQAANQKAYHAALHDAAMYLLDLAASVDGGSIEEQIELMLDELTLSKLF